MDQHHLILRVVTRLLLAPILLFALYVQFHGDYSPGGGFQAGVIFAVAFILYGTVFSLAKLRNKMSEFAIIFFLALGVLIFAGTGIASMIAGYNFLDYNPLGSYPKEGQHYGILIVEFGVGVTVFAAVSGIYYAFAGRAPRMKDQDW